VAPDKRSNGRWRVPGPARRDHRTARRGAAPVATDSLAKQAQAALDRSTRSSASRSGLAALPLGGCRRAPTLGDRATLVDGDDLAIVGWLPKLGAVRRQPDCSPTCPRAMGQQVPRRI
jgi:hypothetical protein